MVLGGRQQQTHHFIEKADARLALERSILLSHSSNKIYPPTPTICMKLTYLELLLQSILYAVVTSVILLG